MIGDGRLRDLGRHQMPDLDQGAAAQIAGVAPQQVRINT
jgi:hypothetical protein